MSYKVVQKRNPTTKNANNIRLFHKVFAIQVFLRARDYELIYIDEFSYSSRKNGYEEVGLFKDLMDTS